MRNFVIIFVIFFIYSFINDSVAVGPLRKREPLRAIAALRGPKVNGNVTFTQKYQGEDVMIVGKIIGLTPGKHGMHIHTKGDITGGCGSAGTHYNHFNVTHGGRTDRVRHIGDLGNIEADANGEAKFNIVDNEIDLKGIFNVIGRTLVIHEKEDDLGKTNHTDSKTTGNAGGRVSCGIIGVL